MNNFFDILQRLDKINESSVKGTSKKPKSVMNSPIGAFTDPEQVQAMDKPKSTGPILNSKKSKKEGFNGRLVGGGESAVNSGNPLIEKAVTLIKPKSKKKKVTKVKTSNNKSSDNVLSETKSWGSSINKVQSIYKFSFEEEELSGNWIIYESPANEHILGKGKTRELAWMDAESKLDKSVKNVIENIRISFPMASLQPINDGKFAVKDTPNGKIIGPIGSSLQECWVGTKKKLIKESRQD